ncbi:tRNA(Ser) Um(44) 2'-O-methyltransferase, partial [Ascosphaera atra]
MSPPLPPADEEFVNSLHQSPLTISSQDGNDTATPDQGWLTSPELCLKDETFTPEAFLQVNELLLANPNLNSTHVFRADILFDSLGQLMSPEEENRRCYGNDIDDEDASHDHAHDNEFDHSPTEDMLSAWDVTGFDLTRT